MHDSIDKQPYEAIGKAKDLFENCCKTILGDRKVVIDINRKLFRFEI